MLLDSTHRRWIVVTTALAFAAVGLHAWLGRGVPGGLRGGSTVGLWYGVAGSLLMLLAGALSAHRRLPVRRWLGKRQSWLRAHIWLGLLSVVVILCHSDYSLGGPLEIALWVVLTITVLSGVIALAAQAIVPHQMSRRIAAETPYEQIPHICDRMRQAADEAVEAALPRLDRTAAEELRVVYTRVRAFLGREFDRASPLAHPLRAEQQFEQLRSQAGMDLIEDELTRLATLCDERRQLGEQARLHRFLHIWLLIHIPITVALLVLGVVHAVMSVYW